MKFYPSHFSKKLFLRKYLSDPVLDAEEKFFRKLLKRKDVFVDVGANVGFFTLLASHLVGPYGRVYAFEPNARVFNFLQGNLSLNRIINVTAMNVALGNENTTGYLHIPKKKDDHSCVSLDRSGVSIPIRRLDDMSIEEKSVDLLKLDVEGYEKYVLEGAKDTLKKVRCIFFEALTLNTVRYGYTIPVLIETLTKLGFKIYGLYDDRLKEFSIATDVPCSSPNLIGMRDTSCLM